MASNCGWLPGPEYDYLDSLTFSPDSKHVAYEAQKGKKLLAVLDSQPGVEYDRISLAGPVFGPEGVLEYLATKDDSLYRVKCTPVP